MTAYDRFVNSERFPMLRDAGMYRPWKRAEGQYLFDDTGTRHLDICAGFGVFALGRNHPGIRQALEQALAANLPNMVQPDCPPLAGELAEALVKHAPPSLRRVFFGNSGTEAVEAAVKFARKATGREHLVHCVDSFHGCSTGAMSLSATPMLRDGFGALIPAKAVAVGDVAGLEAALATRDIAAFVIEPIQGNAVRAASTEYLVAAQRLCREYGTMFVTDEVLCGFLRTGTMFASTYAGITPDIMTVSKILSGGFVPVGACMFSEEIYEKVRMPSGAFPHGSTFGGNAFAMTVGLAVLAELERGDYKSRVEAVSSQLQRRIGELRSRHELIGEIRGRGLMLGVEIRAEPPVVGKIIARLLDEEKVLFQQAPYLKFTPPFILTDADVDHVVSAIDRVLATTKRA